MRSRRDEAYVLGTLELGEADLIVTLVAAEHGRLRGVAKSARSSRRRFGGTLEPLTHVRAVWVEKEGRELHRLESLECLRSFAAMQAEPIRQAACAVLAEVTAAFVHEGEADPRSFRLLGAVLEALEAGGEPVMLVRYFEYWTLRLHGLLPDLDSCPACGKVLAPGAPVRVLPAAGIRCRDCAQALGGRARALTAADRSFLAAAAVHSPAEMPSGLARAGGALETLLSGTLESFAERKFRALRHLRSAAFDPAAAEETS